MNKNKFGNSVKLMYFHERIREVYFVPSPIVV